MDSNFEEREISNIFQVLDDRQSLLLIGLSLGANDLASNLDCLIRIPENESCYFFTNSISILRELAKIIVDIDKHDLCKYHSAKTSRIYEELRADLSSNNEGSFVWNVLKPVRDNSFHYNFLDEKKKKITAEARKALSDLKKESSIAIRVPLNDQSLRGQRYTFADQFRVSATDHFLTAEITSQISANATNIHCYVDSLINDILLHDQVSQV